MLGLLMLVVALIAFVTGHFLLGLICLAIVVVGTLLQRSGL